MSEMRYKMQTWVRRNGAVLEELESTMIHQALEAGWEGDHPNHDQQRALRDAGTKLLAAVEAAKAIPPIPAAEAEVIFRRALDQYEEAARAFSAEGFGTDAATVHQAAATYAEAGEDIHRCAAVIRRATGQE